MLAIYPTHSLDCCVPHLLRVHLQAQDLLRNLIMFSIFLYWLMGLVGMAAKLDTAATKTLWGATCVSVLGVYYTAPLSSVAKVFAERDSSSLHWPLCTMNVINGLLWFAYGLAIKDWFVCLPVSGLDNTQPCRVLLIHSAVSCSAQERHVCPASGGWPPGSRQM